MYTITTDTEAMAANTLDWPMLTSSTRMASVLTEMPVMTGVPVRLLTRDRNLPNGSRLSRAIENITRDAEAWMASVAENIATATRANRALPSQVSSWLSMIQAIP